MDAEAAVIEFATAGCKTMADDTLRLQIDVDPRFAEKAFELFGRRGIHGAIVRLNVDPVTGMAKPEKPGGPNYGKFWQRLIASGFFRAPQACAALGSEKAFESWIRRQPSVLDGAQDWDEEQGEGRCEPAHIRRVSEGAGTAEKPPYFAVPLTHEQHRKQHDSGYSAVHPEGIEWFEKRADQYRTEWASILLARTLDPDVTSRSEVSPDQVREWVREHDLEQYFPKDLRDNTGE